MAGIYDPSANKVSAQMALAGQIGGGIGMLLRGIKQKSDIAKTQAKQARQIQMQEEFYGVVLGQGDPDSKLAAIQALPDKYTGMMLQDLQGIDELVTQQIRRMYAKPSSSQYDLQDYIRVRDSAVHRDPLTGEVIEKDEGLYNWANDRIRNLLSEKSEPVTEPTTPSTQAMGTKPVPPVLAPEESVDIEGPPSPSMLQVGRTYINDIPTPGGTKAESISSVPETTADPSGTVLTQAEIDSLPPEVLEMSGLKPLKSRSVHESPSEQIIRDAMKSLDSESRQELEAILESGDKKLIQQALQIMRKNGIIR